MAEAVYPVTLAYTFSSMARLNFLRTSSCHLVFAALGARLRLLTPSDSVPARGAGGVSRHTPDKLMLAPLPDVPIVLSD